MDAPSGFEQLSILVIDDDEAMRALVHRLLTRLGIRSVVEAESGEQGLEHIASAVPKPSLIICDWHMMGMSGLRLFNELKAKEFDVPFIMLTGSADLDSIVEAKAAGVRGYLIKPVVGRDLQAKVAAFAKVRAQ